MPSLLVTNDFPPKVGGIQSYLWELWRRLPSDEITVLTTPYPGAEEFDRAQPFRVVRDRDRVLLPTPVVVGVSRLVPRKGFDVLIDAVARLDRARFRGSTTTAGATGCARRALTAVDTEPARPVAPPSRPSSAAAGTEPVHLALAGSGRDRERLARRARRAGLEGRFHLLGRVPDEDLAAVYV